MSARETAAPTHHYILHPAQQNPAAGTEKGRDGSHETYEDQQEKKKRDHGWAV